MNKIVTLIISLTLITSNYVNAQTHPCLTLTKKGIKEIKANLGKTPLYDKSFAEVKKVVDAEILKEIDVPIPKELAGGYSHEVHRKNYNTMEKAGLLYQITGDEKYAKYVKNILHKYADLYPTLGLHPAKNSYSRGKLFWQCLNDANWLVSVAQAYDCVYDYLGKSDRARIEKDLFVPFVNFLSIETPQFFNRIHNHSTWGCAGVGMIGLVMNNEDFVKRALYGTMDQTITADQHDNDGGLIKHPGQEKAGFLAQIDGLFSPDGLYSEGAYYHRYGAYPFLIFAASLQNTKPELKIFQYRDSLLIKSVYSLLDQTTSTGEFYPLNDAQKGMSIYNSSLISAVDIAYHFGKRDPSLLTIAALQNEVVLDESGMAVAKNIKNKIPLPNKSIIYKDGIDGKGGAIGILRSKSDLNLVFKSGTHGMGHGHFDQMSYSFYKNGKEVVQDYGMARFVNIEQKAGGVYLPENNTFAKQTIAHNTLVINQKTQYGGDSDEADKYSPKLNYYNFSNPEVQYISSRDSNAYQGVFQNRTLVLVDSKEFKNPFVLDVFNVNSETENTYDLPLYFMGHLMSISTKVTIPNQMQKLGKSDGYQHIWKEGDAKANEGNTNFSWLGDGVFYTYITATTGSDSILLGRSGASDPNFNLRRDPMFIVRKKTTGPTTFASVLEAHGSYSPVTEKAINSYSDISAVEVLVSNKDYTIIKLKTKENKNWLVALANQNEEKQHAIKVEGKDLSWNGPFKLLKF
ncbi:heparinase II/III domain-containing protein [Lacihabitans lacunae]|uniref:Heparinase II/III family protein n=1 Tax=Lacihabitans lacunae TaxID=1028214 RepID=A0ABV7YR18_9BACT